MIHTPPLPSLRLFTGIAAPQDINSRLDDLVRQLKPLARIRWSPASNFHITTKFIGAWSKERLEELKTALSRLQRTGAFPIAIRGLGFFPNAKGPRIFWAGVEGGAPLVQLAASTDEACATLGLEAESKRFCPHLTLARIDSADDLGTLHSALGRLLDNEFGVFDVGAFHLYLSQPGPRGSVYTSLAEFPL